MGGAKNVRPMCPLSASELKRDLLRAAAVLAAAAAAAAAARLLIE